MLKNDQIRRSGVSLNDAFIVYASTRLRDEFDTPDPSPIPPSINQKKPLTSFLNSISEISGYGPRKMQWEKRRAELISEMKQDVIDWLAEGDLIAYAHQLKPTPVRNYRKIPIGF